MDNNDLVNLLVREDHLKTPRIIRAFRSIDRKLFVFQSEKAYADHPLPILRGQTISAPHMVAIMLELLSPRKSDLVLEIGTGSGYNAALLGKLSRSVTSLEVKPQLAALAKKNLKKARVRNVTVIQKDGSSGVSGKFNKIIVTCAVQEVPRSLVRQLNDPGILLAPVGGRTQMLTLIRKKKKISRELHGGCVFVPLQTK